MRFRTTLSILLVLGLIAVEPVIARDGESVLQNRSIGYVATNRDWAVYMTPEGKTECPNGINTIGPREQFKAAYPANGTKRTFIDTAMAYEGAVWFPGSPAAASIDTSSFREAQGKISFGMNLDGKVGPHDFTSPEGEPGVDNQLYRAIGCARMFRESTTSKHTQDSNFNRIVIEITDVDSLTDDDDVTLTTYRGNDSLLLDAGGSGFLPRGTEHLDESWGKPFIQHFRGKIKGGVLETQAGDVALPEVYGPENVVIQRLRGLRWRLKLTPESAEGMAAGYVGIDDFYMHLNRSRPTYLQGVYQLSSLSLHRALERLADGYPDPGTKKNTALSSALLVKLKQVYIIHQAQKMSSSTTPASLTSQ